jgi:RNA polymerase sigma-70 factor, ECF subfamily
MRAEVEQAIALLNDKRPDAVERALALLQQTVFAFSMRVCGHREDAEDTMQDVLVKSIPYLPKFANPKALVVWLYTVAKNQCLMSRRRSKFAPKQELSLEDLMPDATELEKLGASKEINPDDNLLRKEHSESVRRAVLKVPPQYRLVLVLHDMEGLDTAEVAKVTGLRPGTVRVRLHRARLFVRRELAKGLEHRPRIRARKKPAPGADCKMIFAALSDYLDAELPPASCDEIREHMAGCAPCIAFLDDLSNAVSGLKATPPAKPDPQVAARMRKKLAPLLTHPQPRRKSPAPTH